MQTDTVKLTERVSMLEKIIFGQDVPDYIVPPTEEKPFPPIRQKDSGNRDQYGQPIMVDVTIHKPGLLDIVNAEASGVALAGEGGATNPVEVLASLEKTVKPRVRSGKRKNK